MHKEKSFLPMAPRMIWRTAEIYAIRFRFITYRLRLAIRSTYLNSPATSWRRGGNTPRSKTPTRSPWTFNKKTGRKRSMLWRRSCQKMPNPDWPTSSTSRPGKSNPNKIRFPSTNRMTSSANTSSTCLGNGYASRISLSTTSSPYPLKINSPTTSMSTRSTGRPTPSYAVIPSTSTCWGWKSRNSTQPPSIC